MNNNILVLGASGFVGTAVTRALIKSGLPVLALARGADKQQNRLGTQVTLMPGDVTDSSTLKRALAACTGVYIAVPWQIERQTVEAVITQLRALGRKDVQVIYMSGNTVIEPNRWFPMIEEKARTEALLQQSDLPYTIFKTSWFMDALARFVTNGRATVFGTQTVQHRFVALDDYATMVARAFQSTDARRKVFVVNGPEAMTLLDALQAYCDAAHPGLRASSMPIWIAKTMAWMSRNSKMQEAVELMSYFEKVRQVATDTDQSQDVGVPHTTLNAWARAQAGH
jgi:uncharacterized protein YbjT (DUF2867 family)